ncbi:hypothetical protein H7347_01375 [Corynebacterium sp. zg-331]|uniref:hypothetical protein n=1 Tax=unclassified Corynebacterium TaxID=2624378 RepID=UPI00128B2DA4|nr:MULTISPECIES: hypothetical protein [unclassified Corynebacterium]MBC3185238.1 hypothetical protein [Corynebacterium sp. zg-331]MPV51736.1 hypothetical protein [Corynebacterium sp. zg331]
MGQHEWYGEDSTDTLAGAEYREQVADKDVYPIEGPPPSDPREPTASAAWAGIGKAAVGFAAMIAVLALGQSMGAAIERWGYVPVMLVYIVAMMCAGALLTAGAMGLWGSVRQKYAGRHLE